MKLLRAWALLAFGLAAFVPQDGAHALVMSSCDYWKSDPDTSMTRTIRFEDIGQLNTRDAIIISALRDTLFQPEQRVIIRDSGAGGGSKHDITVAARTERHLVYRLPATADVFDLETKERLSIVEFRILSPPARFVPYGEVRIGTDCAEVSGNDRLTAIGPVRAEHRRHDGPRERRRGWGLRDSSIAELLRSDDVEIVDPPRGLGGLLELHRPTDDESASTGDARISDILKGSPEAAPKKIVRGDVEADETAVSLDDEPDPLVAEDMASVCLVQSGEVHDLGAHGGSGPIRVAGLRNEATEVASTVYSAALDMELPGTRQLVMKSDPGDLDVLETSRARRSVGAAPAFTVRPLWAVGSTESEVPDVSEARPRFNVAVFGDRRVVGLSGLASVDAPIADILAASDMRISWYDVKPDGTFNAAQNFDTFLDLVNTAAALETWDVFYSNKDILQRFADGLVDHLAETEERVDLAVWVLEGVILPDEAPQILSAMIRRVGETGNISRFQADGAPRRWLHVIAGRFAQSFSEGYLRGPIARANPPIGDVDVELAVAGTQRAFLADPAKLGLAIRNGFNRLGLKPETGPANAAGSNSDGLPAIAAVNAYERLGIIVERNRLDAFRAQLSELLTHLDEFKDTGEVQSKSGEIIDFTALYSVRSDHTGQPRSFEIERTNVKKRLEAISRLGLLEDFTSFARNLVVETDRAQNGMPDGECGYVFIELVALSGPAE